MSAFFWDLFRYSKKRSDVANVNLVAADSERKSERGERMCGETVKVSSSESPRKRMISRKGTRGEEEN